MAASSQHTPSPGNAFYPEIPAMRAPHMEFVYRLVAKLHPTNMYEIENRQSTLLSRSVIHIKGGTVKGPKISGVVVEDSGADWAERVHAEKIYYKLDARYTVRTDDGHHIYIQANGLFRGGPVRNLEYDDTDGNATYDQDQVEYFTHIHFEAAGNSPYSWMTGIVAIGALISWKDAAVIDCWRLTNFPGVEAEDFQASK